MRSLAAFAALVLLGACASAPDYAYEDRVVIQTVDERELIYFVDRPLGGAKAPALVLIDGSSCVGQLRSNSRHHYRPSPDRPAAYGRIMVEKAGVDHFAEHGAECTDEFRKHYTIDQRVEDHLRVFQHMRANADWWNGEVLVWGWSDGGDIGAQVLAYYPDVTRAVLGAMGGGLTMAEHFEDYFACPEAEVTGAARGACLADLRRDFRRMEDNPTWKRTWSGQDNAWRVWPTRLRSRLTNLLADNDTPVLIVHGALDRENTPVESARALVAALERAENEAYTYWEVPGMAHGWGDLPEPQQEALQDAMLAWLLGDDAPEGGPPSFGADPR